MPSITAHNPSLLYAVVACYAFRLMNSETPTSIRQYRRDIDGLRAVAVLAVVLYHLFPEHLPGGFVGVDVFFVISGFLITQMTWLEISTGSFSFVNFYRRRILRLYPALIVIFAALLAASALTTPAVKYTPVQK